MKKFWATIAMLFATVIWGTAFSAQSESTKHVDALLFVALRSFANMLTMSCSPRQKACLATKHL